VVEDYWIIIESERDTLRYSYAAAAVELVKGNLKEAVALFEKAADDSIIPYTPANCLLAQVYFQTGQWAEGIAELKKLEVDFTETKLY